MFWKITIYNLISRKMIPNIICLHLFLIIFFRVMSLCYCSFIYVNFILFGIIFLTLGREGIWHFQIKWQINKLQFSWKGSPRWLWTSLGDQWSGDARLDSLASSSLLYIDQTLMPGTLPQFNLRQGLGLTIELSFSYSLRSTNRTNCREQILVTCFFPPNSPFWIVRVYICTILINESLLDDKIKGWKIS